METYSQLGQDLQIVNYFSNKKNGYFVEVGAYDGVSISNTYLLEKNYDWNGLCIEPMISFFEQCKINRKCSCVNVAAYNEDDVELEFFECGMLSGIKENIDECHRELVSTSKIIKVLTAKLTTLLDIVNAPKEIDYLSIDVEGSELFVLQGIDFEKYKFGYITLEHNFCEERRTEMRNFLDEKGYKFFRDNEWDDDFVPK